MKIQIETWLTSNGYMANYKINNVEFEPITCSREDEAVGRILTNIRRHMNELFCPPGSVAVDAAMAESNDWLLSV
jgi:hypothetical protein